jgi:hypothetical protein
MAAPWMDAGRGVTTPRLGISHLVVNGKLPIGLDLPGRTYSPAYSPMPLSSSRTPDPPTPAPAQIECEGAAG